MSLGGRPSARGPARKLTPATPMHWATRLANYQNGGRETTPLTPRQFRRFNAKWRAQNRREAAMPAP
jgi:hypothetical protein